MALTLSFILCQTIRNVFYILYKGLNNFESIQEKISIKWVLPTAIGAGLLCGIIWIVLLGPIARRRVEAKIAARIAALEQAEAAKADAEVCQTEAAVTEGAEEDDGVKDAEVVAAEATEDAQVVGGEEPAKPEEAQPANWRKKMPWEQDLHAQSMHESPRAAEIWDEQEKYDENAEGLFNYILVFTACLNSFAHGANDVANTIAPMSAVIQIFQTGVVDDSKFCVGAVSGDRCNSLTCRSALAISLLRKTLKYKNGCWLSAVRQLFLGCCCMDTE